MQTSSTNARRLDAIDNVAFVWMAAYFWIASQASQIPVFPQGIALIALGVVIAIRGIFVPQLKQALQALGGSALFLATAGLVSTIKPESAVLRLGGPIIFHFWSFCLFRIFVANAWGISLKGEATEFRSFLRGPFFLASAMCLTQPVAIFWEHFGDLTPILSGMWIIPYALVFTALRRMEKPRINTESQLQRAMRGRGTVFAVCLLTCLIGAVFGTLLGRSVIQWFPFALIIVVQGLVISYLLELARAGGQNELED